MKDKVLLTLRNLTAQGVYSRVTTQAEANKLITEISDEAESALCPFAALGQGCKCHIQIRITDG